MQSSHRAAAVAAAALALLMHCALVTASDCDKHSRPLPVVTQVTRDDGSGLYLISVRNYEGAQLVLDLAGPLIWWRCPDDDGHHTIPCSSGTCRVANRHHPPSCATAAAGGGNPGSTDPNCNCTAYPYNPVDGKCGAGRLTWEWLSASTTDGDRPLYPVSFRAVASCAPSELPWSLPPRILGQTRGYPGYPQYPGVAGLSRSSPLSLPSQVAAQMKVANKFALCLPSVAVFGGGPVHTPGSDADVDPVTDHLSRTRLLRNPKNTAYYIDVAGIAVNGARVPLPDRALALDAGQGQGGVALSTVTPYTALRPDIYRAVLQAFDAATAGVPRAQAPIKPFELCYNLTEMNLLGTWKGVLPTSIDLMLADGKNWTFPGYSATKEVVPQTLCLAFVEMGPEAAHAVPESPAVIVGGYQMENNLLEFDLKKGVLRYSGHMFDKRMGACGNFNFLNGLGP